MLRGGVEGMPTRLDSGVRCRTARHGYTFVTVTIQATNRTCAWCGVVLAIAGRQGRPRRYCRRAHRQRAYEARRLARRMGLDSGETLVSSDDLQRVRDLLYVLESALDDVESDLRGAGSGEYRRAFQHLYAAAAQLRGSAPEPRARW
jgi:hypothetical protein